MDALDTIKQVGGAIVGIAVLVAVLNPVFGIAFDSADVEADNQAVLEPAPTEFVTLSQAETVNETPTVRPGTGTALGVFGDAEGFADVPPPNATTRTGGWAVAVTVEPIDIDPANSYVIYAEANETILLTQTNGSYVGRYETPGGDTARVSAPADGGRQSLGLEFVASSNELRLFVDGTQADAATATATTTARPPAFEYDGAIDEWRRWSEPVGATAHADYATDPVQPIAPTVATHRAMFNRNAPGELYYANTSLSLVGSTDTVEGVAPPTLERGTDFAFEVDPVKVRALEGGYLDDAPVMFVDAGSGGAFSDILLLARNIGGAALGLLVVGLLVLAAQAVLDPFDSEF